MGVEEMVRIAGLMVRALRRRTDDDALSEVRAEVADLCASFPPYPTLRFTDPGPAGG